MLLKVPEPGSQDGILFHPRAQTAAMVPGTPGVIGGRASQNRQYNKPLSDPRRPKVKERHEIPPQ